MYIKFTEKDTAVIVKGLDKAAKFKPGSSWIVKSLSSEVIYTSKKLLAFYYENNCFPFSKDSLMTMHIGVEMFTYFNVTLDSKIRRMYENFPYYLQNAIRCPKIDTLNGEGVYSVESILRV